MPSLQWLLSDLRIKIQNPCCVGSKVRHDFLPATVPQTSLHLTTLILQPLPPQSGPLPTAGTDHPPWCLLNSRLLLTSGVLASICHLLRRPSGPPSLSTGIPTFHHYSYYHVYFLQIPVSQFAIILFVYFCFVCLPPGVNIPIMASFKQTWHHCTWSWEEMGSSHN